MDGVAPCWRGEVRRVGVAEAGLLLGRQRSLGARFRCHEA